MNRKHWLICGAACIAIAAIALLFFGPRAERRLSAPEEMTDRSEAEGTATSLLENIKAHRKLKNRVKRMPWNIDTSPTTDNILATLTEEQIRRGKLHTKTDPYFWKMAPDILREMWENEAFDSKWTDRITKEAEKMLSSDRQYKGTTLADADCRQSLCKIEFNHDDLEASNRFKASDMDQSSWIAGAGNSLGGFAKSDTGQISTFIYFTDVGDSDTFFRMREIIAERENL